MRNAQPVRYDWIGAGQSPWTMAPSTRIHNHHAEAGEIIIGNFVFMNVIHGVWGRNYLTIELNHGLALD